jgi:hypothetical protein
MDVHLVLDNRLLADARAGAGVPEQTPAAALVRLALARLARWPDAAAWTVARIDEPMGAYEHGQRVHDRLVQLVREAGGLAEGEPLTDAAWSAYDAQCEAARAAAAGATGAAL